MAEQPELLFFDTFSHDSSEELNLDLVQFPKPVYVAEVRIIPLGARVQGDFPGGVRLGATNPTQFQIDFFVNDLSEPGASTFVSLGSLEYCQNGRIHMDCEGTGEDRRQIPTDGLVLRGRYTTITLAVYGTIAKRITERVGSGQGSVPEAPPPPVSVTASPASANAAQSWPDLASTPDVYPASNYSQDDYDRPNYQSEYYDQDPPKDPRSYHHSVDGGNNIWEGRDDKDRPDSNRDRDVPHSRDKERLRLRSRSAERNRSRERNSPRYSRSRSRERDYAPVRSSGRDDGFRRDGSRSPGYRDRERGPSRDKDWDRYKRDDYRRHRQSSYERSRGGSYEKKRGSSYEKRAPSYERRPPSYENRAPSYEKRGSSYEKHLPYEKRLSPYEKRPPSFEKRAPSYEKRSYDKRAPSYERMREASYDSRSRSPGREDPRKRPRTPPVEMSRRPHTPIESNVPDRDNLSPVDSVVSDDEYDHKGKDENFKKYKNRKVTVKIENEKNHQSSNKDPAYLIVKTETQSPSNQKVNTPANSPGPVQEDNASMDMEPFEPILSDEDICDDMEGSFVDIDYELNDYCGMDDALKCFNPFRAEWQQYNQSNKSPLYLAVDNESQKNVLILSTSELCEYSTAFQKLTELMTDLKNCNIKYTYNNFLQLTIEDKEEWVKICEKFPNILNTLSNESDVLYRIFKTVDVKGSFNDDFKYICDTLLNFCQIGLDYEMALSQNRPLIKIRHIKCGIRLIEALTSNKHNELIVTTLLENNIDVYCKFLELYSKKYMALSIKLLILKALEACLGSETSIERFLTERFYDINDSTSEKKTLKKCSPNLKNGYQILIGMLNKNPLSRLKFAINALIHKMNLFELLKKLHESVLQLNMKGNNGQIISESEIELIINSLEEVLCVYRNGSFEISQPRRFLPVSVQFDVKKNCMNHVLIDFFNIHKLLETCLYLLTCPLTYNYPVITNPIYEILVYLVNSHEGLTYLLGNIKTCDLLFQTLMEPYTHQNEEEQLMLLQDVSGCTSLQHLGLEIAYKLQASYYIHGIFELQNGEEVDESELFDKLHGLYCLGFGNIGKLTLASVLGMGDNIQCLLNVYEKDIHVNSVNEDSSIAKKKSPTKNYAVDLTVSTIQFNSDVNFLKKYGRRILNVAKKFDLFEQSIASNLQEVLPYLKPLEKPNVFSNDNICDIVEILKGSIEHVTSAPGDLITCLRILKYLGIPEYENKKIPLCEAPKTEFTELKYKYVILQLFSLDGVSLLISILEKLCTHFEQPSLHTATFVSVHGLHIANIVLPCLELLNKMLTYVIQCRNTQFKDLTSIPVILQTYNLMYSYPATAVSYKMAQKACRECIEILLAHTQPIAEDASENESIHKSLWTLLCNEIIKYILTAPYTFVPGLLIFSEILPLPLPIQTKYTLTDNELSNMVSNRKLWSAHLHTLTSNLTEMIQSICLSVCQPVVHLLRRVCIQLTDLASNTALCVTRAVLDLLISHVCDENNTLPEPLTPLNYNIARILNFLAYLMTHPSVKCTTLHLIRQSTSVPKTNEDRYSLFIPLLCSILSTVNDTQSHVQAQEWVISIIISLCYSEVTLLTQLDSVPAIKMENQEENVENVKPVMTPEIYLSNAVPSKDVLISLINASLDYLNNGNNPSLILGVLRTFFVVIEHDYGFYYFKFCVDKNKTVFAQLFNKLVNNIKDSSDCLSTFIEFLKVLQSFIDLLKVLQSPSEDLETTEQGLQCLPRTNMLTIHDIAEFIGWHKNKDHHPILVLEKFLKDVNTEFVNAIEELSPMFFKNCQSNIHQLLMTLQSIPLSSNVELSTLPIPPVLRSPEHLVTQFSGRCLWTQDVQDERLGSTCIPEINTYIPGISTLQTEDDATDAEMISCDLAEITHTYLAAGTDLVAEAERLLHLPPAVPRPPSEPPLFRTKRLHVPREKRPYVIGSATARVQVDAFRSRPPNTSRPPSLHVDDFLALEGCGAQPTGPTGYNKLPMMTSRGGRGLRSRGITVTDRGRFASATPTSSTIYSRRGRGGWSTVGSATNSISGDGSPPLSSHFPRTASSHFQSPIMQYTTSQYSVGTMGWSGVSRGSRRGRGLRHSRASFLR